MKTIVYQIKREAATAWRLKTAATLITTPASRLVGKRLAESWRVRSTPPGINTAQRFGVLL